MNKLTVHFKCRPGKGEDLLREQSAGLLGDRRAREGSVSSDAYVDADDPDAIMLIEEWESWDDLERWVAMRVEAGLHDAFVEILEPILAVPLEVSRLEPNSA